MSTDTAPNIPDRQWTNPFPDDSPLGKLYGRRVKQESDLVIVVSDYHNRRGTGKTILSLRLADMMDRTDEGLTKEKVSLEPEEIRESYANQPMGSGLVLDEAEAGIDNRSAMTKVNRAMREIVSMGRVEQKYLVLNAPSSAHIDKSIKELADVWMLVQKRGNAIVHFFEYNPYGNKPLTPKKQSIQWDDIQAGTRLHDVYRYLTREKRDRIAGSDGRGFIAKDEHEHKVEKAVKDARQDTRNDLIREVYGHPDIDVTQKSLGECVDLTTQAINNIVNS